MKTRLSSMRLSFWGYVFIVLLAAGIYAYFSRAVPQPQAGAFPWDLSFGLAVLCGMALCAGGFAVAATIRILHLENYKPVLRISLLTGFVGYFVAIVGFFTSAVQPIHIGLTIVPSSRPSITGAVWMLSLFGLVILLEFAPDLASRFGWHQPPKSFEILSLPFLLLAVILAVLHQTSLADLVLSNSAKISPLWSTPQLPFLFFVSAACAGLAAVVFALWHTRAAFGLDLPIELTEKTARALAAMLFFYIGLRIADFLGRGIPLVAPKTDPQNFLLGLEFTLFFVPMWLLMYESHRLDQRLVYYSSAMVLAGLITNRLNTCITSMESSNGFSYVPPWNEFMIAYSAVGIGVAIFYFVSKRLPVFSEMES